VHHQTRPPPSARRAAVLIGEEDPEFADGSYVVAQKYLHDLQAWNALTVENQERAFGRTKLNDIELPDELKPANFHLALNTIIDQNGEQRQIMRFNMPFSRVGAGEFGTYFIGYIRSPEVIEQMLKNMFIGRPPGNYDRILDFSTAVTGNLFFIPTVDFVGNPPTPAPCATQRRGCASVQRLFARDRQLEGELACFVSWRRSATRTDGCWTARPKSA